MTEEEWLGCTDLIRMLEFLRGKASDRKLRLFFCACCRETWHLLTDERSRKAVEVAEEYADGLTSQDVLEATRQAAFDAWKDAVTIPARVAAFNAMDATAAMVFSRGAARIATSEVLATAQPRLLHDIFGNPFRTITVDLSRVRPNISKVAKTVYNDRASDRLPELADVLEKEGCTDTTILAHCRGPGPHVRGCWVVDLMLGKE